MIAAASTGNANIKRKEVIKIDHTNSGRSFINIASHLKKNIVLIKFIDAAIEEAPTKWKLKITKSTAKPECDCAADNGG